jgi:type II secretory pathway predicted ATPase ExeA
MTLEEHFGLSQPPFPKAATELSLLRHSALQEILDKLRFALGRDTIALLVAESGCGKSTILGLFAKSLDAGSYHVLATSLTTVGPFGLISHLAALSGLRPCRFKGDTAATFIAHLRGLPKRTVLLVDEAHMMPDASLEDLRLLTACDFDRRSPFALVLVGQPLLRERLNEPQHYSLTQRIGVRLRLRPLSDAEMPLFLDRHLKAAGARKSIFEPDAIAALFQHTRGVPRLVQNAALAAMLACMENGKKTVDAAAVQQAVADLEAA